MSPFHCTGSNSNLRVGGEVSFGIGPIVYLLDDDDGVREGAVEVTVAGSDRVTLLGLPMDDA